MPDRSEITLPLRGKALRDRYVLRVIAFERMLHVAAFVLVAFVILAFARHEGALRADFTEVVSSFEDNGRVPSSGVLAHVARLFHFTDRSLYVVAMIAIAYAAMESVEAVGLWFAKRWAEYLTFLATVVFLPIELRELSERITFFRVSTLLINLVVAGYLLWSKRLFGLRGGGRVESAARERDQGWDALDRSTPP